MVTPDLPAVVVTGSSKGVGRALVNWYLTHGRSVVGLSRSASDIEHPAYLEQLTDISVEAEVVAAIGSVVRHVGPIGLLVNNAGVEASSPVALMTDTEIDRVLTTNIHGTMTVTREVVKAMRREGRGRIVNISSAAVPLGPIGSGLYGASKAALMQFSKVVAWENADLEITINTIGLSLFAASGMLSRLDRRALSTYEAALPKPEYVTVEQLVHLIECFESEATRNVTNQVVYFGGLS